MNIEESSITIEKLLSYSLLKKNESRILLAHSLGYNEIDLIIKHKEIIHKQKIINFFNLESRRIKGEPIAYLINSCEFYGIKFIVTPYVMIPRHETELLVDLVLEVIKKVNYPKILDLGTGSGVIAISIAFNRSDSKIWAIDYSNKSISIAYQNINNIINLLRPGGKIKLINSNWYSRLNSKLRFHVIVSNPPYIAKNDHHLLFGDLRFEPRQALTDEYDGLKNIRHIINYASKWLLKNGVLCLEHGYNQAEQVRNILHFNDFVNIRSIRDISGIYRVSIGIKKN